jgi:hypothetical protein
MPKDRTQPEMIPTLEISDEFRHPMWSPPKPEEQLAVHLRALRVAIANGLIPFDGRSDLDFATGFCEEAYNATRSDLGHPVSNYLWVLGKITWLRHHWMARLSLAADEGQPANRQMYRRNLAVVSRLGDQFTEAVYQSVAP